MLNRGKYRHIIDIYEKTVQNGENDIENDLGEYDTEYVFKKKVFASIEFRGGGLLSGRPADTVMSNVTHKISYPYNEYPVLTPDKNEIRFTHGGVTHKYDIQYTLNDNFKDEELQVFVSERV